MTSSAIENGTRRLINGVQRVFYDGYWIKAYEIPADTLRHKRELIEGLTRRLFNHVEHGINIPGHRLDDIRRAFDAESDPERKRVKGAMLAGALFNRATDIFSKLMELQELGVEVETDNALMRQCGACLQEALKLGSQVRHRSGEEGIDELWGEPFRAFSVPIEAFYETRYVKIAQTMHDIDQLGAVMVETFECTPFFEGIGGLVLRFTATAKVKCETLRTDPVLFDVWADFAVAAEQLRSVTPRTVHTIPPGDQQFVTDGVGLIVQGCDLVSDITRARVPMPKNTREYIGRCERYRSIFHGR